LPKTTKKWTSGLKPLNNKQGQVRPTNSKLSTLLFGIDAFVLDALSKGGNKPGLLVESSDDEDGDGLYSVNN